MVLFLSESCQLCVSDWVGGAWPWRLPFRSSEKTPHGVMGDPHNCQGKGDCFLCVKSWAALSHHLCLFPPSQIYCGTLALFYFSDFKTYTSQASCVSYLVPHNKTQFSASQQQCLLISRDFLELLLCSVWHCARFTNVALSVGRTKREGFSYTCGASLLPVGWGTSFLHQVASPSCHFLSSRGSSFGR